MKKLSEDQMFDTGLTRNGKPVAVGLVPDRKGGRLIFKCGHKRRAVPLAQILMNLIDPAATGTTDLDVVNLGALESWLMVSVFEMETDEEEAIADRVKGLMWRRVRELREHRREAAGYKPVAWGRLRPIDED